MTKPAGVFLVGLLGALACARTPPEPTDALTPPSSAATSVPARASHDGGAASSPAPLG